MSVRTVSSTEAQNNFGRVLDDVIRTRARYVVTRRGLPQAIVLSFDDFKHMLLDDNERTRMGAVLSEMQPEYSIGHVIYSEEEPQ